MLSHISPHALPRHSIQNLRQLFTIAVVGWMTAWAGTANAQATQADVQRDAQEQRRTQERESLLRDQQERTPDIRLPTGPAQAETRLLDNETPCFAIEHIALQGDTTKAFTWLLATLSGPDNTDAPIGRCLGAKSIGVLQKRGQDALVAQGFITSRFLAQPQDLSKGTLTFTVLPGRIHAIRFKDAGGANTNLTGAIPAKPGDILNLRDIEQALENLKRVPTAEADIQVVPADQPDRSDLVVAYQKTTPIRVSLSLDDSGGKSSGVYQGGVTLSWDNPLGLNDLFYITRNHDAGGGDPGPRGTQGNSVHYSVPYGYWMLGTTFGQSSYHQTVVGLNQTYIYSGTSGNAEVKLSRLIYRDATRKTTLSLKTFERHSNNFIDDTEVLVQRRVVGGWELGANHKVFVGAATVEGNLAYKRGTGDHGAIPAPEEASNEGTSRFGLIAADASLTWPFKASGLNLRYNGTLRLQDNTTPLTPQDRFSIGGRYTVRGFDGESSLSAERGVLWRNEMSVALGDSGQEAYLGVDYGEVSGPSSEMLAGKSLSGAVIGLRGGYKKLQYEVFVGTPLYKPHGFKTAETTAGFNLNLSF